MIRHNYFHIIRQIIPLSTIRYDKKSISCIFLISQRKITVVVEIEIANVLSEDRWSFKVINCFVVPSSSAVCSLPLTNYSILSVGSSCFDLRDITNVQVGIWRSTDRKYRLFIDWKIASWVSVVIYSEDRSMKALRWEW